VQAGYIGITDRYIVSSTKITVYRSINLLGVEGGYSISRRPAICNLGVVDLTLIVDLTLMHSYVEAREVGLW
jgi:hypothetical protein